MAAFFNKYNDVYSLETLPGTLTYQQQNGTEGKSFGAEFSGLYEVSDNWRIRFGYTYIDVDLKAKKGRVFNPDYLSTDAKHQAMLHSMVDLPLNFHFDFVGRYLSEIPQTLVTSMVPAYFTFDARLAYTLKFAELSIVGQNLAEKNHSEYGPLVIPRSYYAKLAVRL